MSGYIQLGTVLQWLEKPSGKTVAMNRDELVTLANDIRRHFYLLYDEVQLFMDAEECFCVQEYFQDCRTCQDRYFGITLPPGMHQVEGMIVSGTAFSLHNKWREYKAGVRGRSCRNEATSIGDGFATERDFGDCPYPIKFLAKHPADCGKKVTVRYVNMMNGVTEEQITLSTSYQATEGAAKGFARPGGVVLPTGLKGGVIVSLCNDASTILSEYQPWESIPSYTRMRINNVCCNDVVMVRASRKFHELWYDTDTVETDNKLAIEQAALGIRFRDTATAEPTMFQKAAIHFANARKYLLGEKSRDEGMGVTRRFEFGNRTVVGSRITRRCAR